MELKIEYATPNPIEVISKAAGTSYGKDDISFKRIKHCFKNGHMGVFEHAVATFHISGISRACSHQLVRHRIASFVQKSQRYTEIVPEDQEWYVMPKSYLDNGMVSMFRDSMYDCILDYQEALNHGVKPEDARYLLPEATKTEINMTMNLNSLFHFFDLRCDSHAQWEIRYLAEGIKDALYLYNDEWESLIDLYDTETHDIRKQNKELKKENEQLKQQLEELKDRVFEAMEDDWR